MIAALAFTLLLTHQAESYVEKIPSGLASFKMIRIPDGQASFGGKTYPIKNMWVSETEVTWDLYDIYAFSRDLTDVQRAKGVDAESRPSRPYGNYDRGFGHSNFPAIGMSLNGAEMFCKWLSKTTGKTYRLPNDAEWEYLARAGASAEPSDLDKVAWSWENSDDSTHEVAKKQPNAWGLYDTLGNASEWVESLDAEKRIVRGGCWNDKKDLISFTKRVPYDPKWQEEDAQLPKSNWWYSDGPYMGLRVVCVR